MDYNPEYKSAGVRKRPSPKAIYAISALVFFLLGASFFVSQLIGGQTLGTTSPQIPSVQTPDGQNTRVFPMRLQIPSLNVDTNVEFVGINEQGEMEVPSNTTDVGWYRLGPSPGEQGNAVISGHVDGNGRGGVFKDLDKLKSGDKVYIVDGLGQKTAFGIRESRIYNPGYADEVFFANEGVHLNLVTCDGSWDEGKKTYSKRLVVFADKL